MSNKLIYGDNLAVLRQWVHDESVDLVYLDPPFNSNQNYNVLFSEQDETRNRAQIQAFEDTWHWDDVAGAAFHAVVSGGGRVAETMVAFERLVPASNMLAYLSMMAPRLQELHRVLKPTGSLYLHCDPTASHFLKILLDAIFGPQMFRNEIIWKRTSGHSDARRYGSVHDTILYYTKTEKAAWYKPYQNYDEGYIEQYYRYRDDDGRRFMSSDLSAAGLTGGGYEYEWRGVTRVWRAPIATMERYEAEGRIFYTKNGIPRLKRYLDEAKGMPAQDVWTDIEALRSWHKEKMDYPTQKPEPLLERIIEASTAPGDVVLDPFCGCGTSIVVAERLGRSWVGIDVTALAVTLMKNRLTTAFEAHPAEYEVIGEPTTLDDALRLASEDPYQFQWWALGLVGARPAEGKKGADRGIDGRQYFVDEGPTGRPKQIIYSVKAGKSVSVAAVRDLGHVVQREDAAIGVLISMHAPTKAMRSEAATMPPYVSPWDGRPYPRVQIFTIEELLDGKRPEHPNLMGGDRTFKPAPRASRKTPGPDRLFD
jgi:DNA modification methylase